MSDTTYQPLARLSRILPSAPGQYNFSDSDAVHLMVLLRELLEQGNNKNRFPVLNLYCNWTVHPEITGSRVGYKLLARLAAVLQHLSDMERLADAVSQELSLVTFRTELLTLLKEAGVATILFESIAGWEMFGGHFFKAILGKRLRFPPQPDSNERSSDIYNAMLAGVGSDTRRLPTSISLLTGVGRNPHAIQWVIELANGTELTGQLKNLENNESFPVVSFR